ncbi:MAG: HlyD family secretion protein [Bacillota bacterium]
MTVPGSGLKTGIIPLLKGRRLLFCAAALLIIVAAVFLIRGRTDSAGSYLTEPVARGDVIDAITASGTVEAETSVPLTFKNQGVIKAIYVKEGQTVTKGQLLAEQDDSDLKTQYNQQMANLKSAEAKLALARAGATKEDIAQAEENVNLARINLEQAKSDFDRNDELFKSGALSGADRDKYENDYKLAEVKLRQAQAQLDALKAGSRPEDILAAEAQVEAARAQVEAAGNNLDSARLVSPADGVIGLVSAVVGQRTNGGNSNNSADGFITLISTGLKVEAMVNEADVGKAAVGQKATFTVNSYPGREFLGTVESISPKAETVSNVQLYRVVIALDKQEPDLKVGMPANVNIIINQRENVVTVPKTAVTYAARNMAGQTGSTASGDGSSAGNRMENRQGTGGWKPEQGSRSGATGERDVAVFVMENGKRVLRQIKVGIDDSTNYEVIEGLKEGELLVIGDSSQAVTTTSSNPSSRSSNSSSPQRRMLFMGH